MPPDPDPMLGNGLTLARALAVAGPVALGGYLMFGALRRVGLRSAVPALLVAIVLVGRSFLATLGHGPAVPLLMSADAAMLLAALVFADLTHRDEIAGFSLGLAATLQPAAALLLPFFAWKRRWRVLAWAAITAGLGLAARWRALGDLPAPRAGDAVPEAAILAAVLALASPLPFEVRRTRRGLAELALAIVAAAPLWVSWSGDLLILFVPGAIAAAIAIDALRGARELAAAVPYIPLQVLAAAILALADSRFGAGLFLAGALVATVVLERRAARLSALAPPPRDLELSVFFPAYNEGLNIGRVVERTLEVLPKLAKTFEVIVVDDCSKDDTPAVVGALAEKHPGIVRHVRHPQNRGYGGAVKTGLASARYRYVFFSDGDGQFDIAELPEFVRPLGSSDVDAVIGFRRRRRDPFFRLVNAYCWGALVRTLFGIAARDIDCAYKVLPAALVQRLELKSEGALISTEILAKLDRAGCRAVERPVTHLPRERGAATGASPKVILRAFRELFRFRRELARFRLAPEAAPAAPSAAPVP